MTNFTLTALDVTGIQRYIFNSNRLKENVGASELVYRATHHFVFEKLPQPHNVELETGQLKPKKDEAFWIEKGQIDAEVLYAAGGNVLILFKDTPQAKELVTALSQKLIIDAPGLDLVAAHYEFDWKNETIGQARQTVLSLLEQVKNQRVTSQPVLGLSVTVACQSTGFPAVAIHPDADKKAENYPISAEVWAKVGNAENANERFKDFIRTEPKLRKKSKLWEKIENSNYYFPMAFDDFGRSEDENSYIAVVHADVNSMGERVRQVFAECQRQSNRDCINKIRAFSDSVRHAARTALVETVAKLVNTIEDNSVAGEIPLTEKQDEKSKKLIGYYLPFRPLVFGGDDLTFVCDGRLGLTLAVTYLNAFEAAIEDPTISASAGIAVVKTHYPFARAYQLAEDLAKSAKMYVGRKSSALDWHFAASGLLGELDDIRESQYRVDDGKLYMRPVRLRIDGDDWRTWQNFSTVTQEFKKDWANLRNKVIKLRQALRKGRSGVTEFLAAYEEIQHLPALKTPLIDVRKTGWANNICAYFDAIEAMDFYVPLGDE